MVSVSVTSLAFIVVHSFEVCDEEEQLAPANGHVWVTRAGELPVDVAACGGSVGIGGAQTGVYPQSTPGGWQLIGRTATALFSPDQDPPCLLQPGDQLRFKPISLDEFLQQGGQS